MEKSTSDIFEDLYSFSIDIDWAPDFMIESMAQVFIEHRVKCTWFVTHDSPAIRALRENELFELGIHPNFLKGSSHGNSEDEVIEHCLNLVPDAKAVRSHALYQNSNLLWRMRNKYDLQVDCSLFLPYSPQIIPHTLCHSAADTPLVRIPFFWEDDVECLKPDRQWKIDNPKLMVKGLKMFNFHPFYVGINETDFSRYLRIKKELCTSKSLNQLTIDETAPYKHNGEGAGSFFRELIKETSHKKRHVMNASEIAAFFLQTL